MPNPDARLVYTPGNDSADPGIPGPRRPVTTAASDAIAAVRPSLAVTAASRPTYWIYHELWRLITGPDRGARLAVIRRGKDAIFDWNDPLPFLMVHHLQIPWLLAGNLVRRKDWIRIDFNIGKLVEPAGD